MIQRRIFSARSSLLRTRRIPDTPSSARLLLTENLSPLEPRYRGNIGSLQRFKDSVKEVAANYECGMSVEKFNDIKEGDIFECFVMEEIPR